MELRAISDDEVPAFRECMMHAFGSDTGDDDPDGDRRFRALIAHGNAWAMFDGAQVVGCAGLYDLSIGIPGGGSLGCAGLTMVGVRATHRRRGILSQMIERYLVRAREHGHAIAGLWASEAPIARRGASKRRHVIAVRDGTPVGYVQYRQRQDAHPPLGGRSEIIEMHGLATRAVATLWRYMCSIDLHPNVVWAKASVDDSLQLVVEEPLGISR